jgi:preprotein translocase subunit SecF
MGAEIDSLFVTALLVILGFSIHDTIVVFDRVRENLRKNTEYRRKEEFETVVGKSVAQTFARSINTSLTTLLTLFVLYIVGSDATRWFSLALLIGITSGTYSSVFLASPLLVTVEKWQRAKLAKAGK